MVSGNRQERLWQFGTFGSFNPVCHSDYSEACGGHGAPLPRKSHWFYEPFQARSTSRYDACSCSEIYSRSSSLLDARLRLVSDGGRYGLIRGGCCFSFCPFFLLGVGESRSSGGCGAAAAFLGSAVVLLLGFAVLDRSYVRRLHSGACSCGSRLDNDGCFLSLDRSGLMQVRSAASGHGGGDHRHSQRARYEFLGEAQLRFLSPVGWPILLR
ncbi:hypothetical protein HAX54_015868 [Datura stramonium]|uniref:Uncharacterized protein n=1 Tax=Datura stramonium TaxID=4076 RepID=A0ABS8UHZ3_DATST|nr:hypothetical protein [Datura stramonium]